MIVLNEYYIALALEALEDELEDPLSPTTRNKLETIKEHLEQAEDKYIVQANEVAPLISTLEYLKANRFCTCDYEYKDINKLVAKLEKEL